MLTDESQTLKNIYEEVIRNRNELKNIIEASEARILLKLEAINNRVVKLEKENKHLKDKVETLERQQKRNNIIIFGINKPSNEISAEYICHEINSLLGTNLVQDDINDTYALGRTKNRPIKVELLSQTKKRSIIQNCHKLKGKDISIAHDLTPTQREEAKTLRRHLFLARENTEHRCYIKGNRLIVNNKPYTAKELVQIEESEEDQSEKKNSSAPATPTVYHRNTFSPKTTNEVFDFTSARNQVQESTVEEPCANILTSQKNSSSNTPKPNKASSSRVVTAYIKEKPKTRSTSSQKK